MICRCVINTNPGKNILSGMSKGKSFDLMQTCIEKNAIITSLTHITCRTLYTQEGTNKIVTESYPRNIALAYLVK